MKKGLSLLDFLLLNQQDDYASEKLKDFIKTYGSSIESNIELRIRLLNRIPEIYEKTKGSKLKSRPLQLLLNRIQELERKLDQYILLIYETDTDLPDSITDYVHLKDILDYYKSGLKPDQTDDPLNSLKEESEKKQGNPESPP